MRTIEGILVSQKSLTMYFRFRTGVDLWRAFRTDEEPKTNPLHPDLDERQLPNGKKRDPDVGTVMTRFGRYVRAIPSMGCSLMDIPNGFGHQKWKYFFIPNGTIIPHRLIITRDRRMRQQNCWHYSISPNYTMTELHYLTALNELAANAIFAAKKIV